MRSGEAVSACPHVLSQTLPDEFRRNWYWESVLKVIDRIYLLCVPVTATRRNLNVPVRQIHNKGLVVGEGGMKHKMQIS
jgi:hypothetical protein